MKILRITIWVFIITTNTLYAQKMKCLTYNIRYDNPKDGENRWELRKEHLSKQILFYEPEVFGVQEALNHQVQFLEKSCVAYDYVGVGRDDGKAQGEYAAIFYKKDQFNLLKSGHFWLSETPNVPSKAWDAALPRICTYVLLEYKNSSKQIWVFNTHFDHRGVQARVHSAHLITKQIQNLNQNNAPVILMGDFNLLPDSEPVKVITNRLKDSFEIVKQVKFGPIGTFNSFQIDYPLDKRIDYIFVSGDNVIVEKYAVLSGIIDQKFLSDHLPVYTELELR